MHTHKMNYTTINPSILAGFVLRGRMSKNTTAILRGSELAKEQLKLPSKTPLIKLADMEEGNREQRRSAAKQKRREK